MFVILLKLEAAGKGYMKKESKVVIPEIITVSLANETNRASLENDLTKAKETLPVFQHIIQDAETPLNYCPVLFKKLHSDVILPSYSTAGASGMDVRALNEVNIGPGQWAAVPTGLALEIDPGFEVQVRPRSGLAAKFGVTVLNSPGTIDSDYKGEVKILLINHSQIPFCILKGDRIAQLVVAQVSILPGIVEVEELTETKRGSGGLGSTGVK
jgi:dUTP pyrophosphatase